PATLDRGLDKRLDILVIEVRCGLDRDAAYFGAGALEKPLRVGEGLVEVQPDTARIDGQGNDGLVSALRHPEPHHERLGVVVNELVGARDYAAELGQK